MKEIIHNNNILQESGPESVLNILLIEDNPGDILIVNNMLKKSGHPVNLVNASSLRDSAVLLAGRKFDAVLLDLGLPDSSGLDTLKEFLSLKFVPPVVVMTGFDDEDTALASLRQGAQDYLVKNRLDTENIIRSVKYSIERKKLHDLQIKNSNQLSILSSTTASFYEAEDTSFIYSIICSSVRLLLEDAIVFSIEFDEGRFSLNNTEQLLPWKESILSSLGIDLDKSYPLTAKQKEFSSSLSDGTLVHLKGGISDLVRDMAQPEVCNLLQDKLGLKIIYAAGFLRNTVNFGGIFVFTPDEIDESDIKIIENLCSQASLSIYRRQIQKNLIESESRYQKLARSLEKQVRKRTRELEIVNKHLSHELKERKQAEEALIKSETQLKELNATKDKFFNIVAHDLKNPFTSLLGATELLSHNIDTMDREKIKRLSQILNDSAKSGYAILLNLLDWSRSQTGMIRINRQNINLRKLIEDNLADVHLNSLDKQITISSGLTEDILIVADKNMLNTILRNLISNAVKFTRRGGKVSVNGYLQDNEVIISVKDNGIGISTEDQSKLFRIDSKFSRPGTEKELGTGLGLKLSKEFIEKLGGRIWVESIEDAGSEFFISMPLTC